MKKKFALLLAAAMVSTTVLSLLPPQPDSTVVEIGRAHV